MEELQEMERDCTQKQGQLPACAPLAAAFIPMQQEDPGIYGNADALTRGTLFPGLDLPFLNTANKTNPCAGTPLGDLMAVDFVIQELMLYLDTHRGDTEAFRMLQKMLQLSREGREAFTRRYGPIGRYGLQDVGSYTWVDAPWPWEMAERTDQ